MCSGVVPQQPPHDVEQAIPCEFAQQPSCHLRGFVKLGLAHGVGQARVGVTADKGVTCGRGQLLQVGSHQGRTHGAVQTYGEWPYMPHAMPKARHRLAAQHTTRCILHCATQHHGQALTTRLKKLFMQAPQFFATLEMGQAGRSNLRSPFGPCVSR
jgi:hypothetical protein